ncbi:MAG: hypothetical protein FIB03_15520, partial [Anaerolineae bacterium]|nr:hypothetical protein [Anaerolineae bacterium]
MSGTKEAILRRQPFRIIAQDPAVRINGRILTAQVDVPAEELAAGPWGHRVQVIDYDASTQKFYRPLNYQKAKNGSIQDPFADVDDETLLGDPRFH